MESCYFPSSPHLRLQLVLDLCRFRDDPLHGKVCLLILVSKIWQEDHFALRNKSGSYHLRRTSLHVSHCINISKLFACYFPCMLLSSRVFWLVPCRCGLSLPIPTSPRTKQVCGHHATRHFPTFQIFTKNLWPRLGSSPTVRLSWNV